MRREIRVTFSVTRLEYEKLKYLADRQGQSLGTWVYWAISREIIETIEPGGEIEAGFSLMQELKGHALGYRQLAGMSLAELIRKSEEMKDGEPPF